MNIVGKAAKLRIEIFEYIRSNGGVTMNDIRKHFTASDDQIRRALRNLGSKIINKQAKEVRTIPTQEFTRGYWLDVFTYNPDYDVTGRQELKRKPWDHSL